MAPVIRFATDAGNYFTGSIRVWVCSTVFLNGSWRSIAGGRVYPRQPRLVSLPGIALAILLGGLATLGTGIVRGQTPPSDLPPPPGTLERELSLAPEGKDSPGMATGGPSLANPIEIPFLLEGGHIIVEASIDGTPSRPFIFDTGAKKYRDT
jgi:hypothetical protein